MNAQNREIITVHRYRSKLVSQNLLVQVQVGSDRHLWREGKL